jgi:hypothetical protein
MCGKENAVALPAVLAVADLLQRRDEPLVALMRRRALRYAALTAALVAFVALRSLVTGQVTPTTNLLDNPLSTAARSRLPRGRGDRSLCVPPRVPPGSRPTTP